MKPPVFSIIESEVIGVPGNADSLHPVPDLDRGRVLVSGSEVHEKSFKTPTVRNVGVTAPYMHNGVYRTLEEVVEFYNRGGGRGLGLKVPNQTLPFDHLNLDAAEKKSLVAFMRSLTDTAYRKNY
jgi:cytochrome c peroxidase